MKKTLGLAITGVLFIHGLFPLASAQNSGVGAAFTGPLRVSGGARYFTDGGGNPFFWLGDTAWQLFTSYSQAEAITLLDNRQAKGFTVIQSVLCVWPGSTCGANTSGQRPFLNGNPATPNDAYFANVDAIVDAAAARGIVIAMLPVWGSNYVSGSPTGGSTLVNASNARAYGRYLGNRYKSKGNVIWLLGGDTAVYDKASVYKELAAGIRETDAQNKLIGYHPAATDRWPSWNVGATSHASMNPYGSPESSLDFHMAESYKWYDKIPFLVNHMYSSVPAKPAVLGEGSYEGGPVDAACCASYAAVSPWDIRKQAYWSYLSGGSFTYGHEAIWSHGAKGGSWQSALDAPGAQGMAVLKNVLTSRAWWDLTPDHSIFVNGPGSGIWQNASAKSSSGDSAVVYLSGSSAVTLDLTRIAGGDEVNARWIDPRNGAETAGGQYSKSQRSFTPPAGFEDALLVLEAVNQASDTKAPSVASIQASQITQSSATISWQTDEAASSSVEYGLTAAYTHATAADAQGQARSITISGLSAGVAYHFRVKAVDEAGNQSVSPDATFTTLAATPEVSNPPSPAPPSESTPPATSTPPPAVAPPPASTPPSAVTSLAVSAASRNSVVLSWNSPMNAASGWSLDIRYSTNPITEANWAGALQVGGEPEPMPAGVSQSHVLSGLSLGRTYYIAMKTVNSSGTASTLSNVVSFATADAKSISRVVILSFPTSNRAQETLRLR